METPVKSKCLVVSAVNFSDGGPLTILLECLKTAALTLPAEWEIIALVHDNNLINENRVKCISLPKAKSSWFLRLYYEWFYFKKISKKLRPDLWLSLHDITPRVNTRRQAVYCHNPSPFYNATLADAKLEPKFWLFTKLYRYLYRANIWKNDYVIVQQDWLRTEFFRFFGELPVVVAQPKGIASVKVPPVEISKNKIIFLYPAFPRVFKNFEVVGEAVRILNERKVSGFEVRITIKGNENSYAGAIYERYSDLKNLSFIGLQNKIEMAQQYNTASVVVFPSKLETWGLPITEAKEYGKMLLVSNLPYAKETVGTYDDVSFFPSSDAVKLADLMNDIIEGKWIPDGSVASSIKEPFSKSWNDLWLLLIKDL